MDRFTHLAAEWQQEEQQLYGSLLFDEARYERAMLVLRQALDLLADCATDDDLIAAAERRQALVEEAARRAGVTLEGLPAAPLAAGALRLRLARLRNERRRRDAAAAIDAAVARGGGWAVLYEQGADGPGQPPYEQLAVYVPPDGGRGEALTGVHSWTGLDDETDDPRYGLAAATVHLGEGGAVTAPEPAAEPEEHRSPADWTAAWERLRAWVCDRAAS